MSKKKLSMCKRVHRTIMEKGLQFQYPDEDRWIQNHLEICENCRDFVFRLHDIQKTLKQFPEGKLKPHPEIIEQLMRRFDEKKAKRLTDYKTGQILNTVLRLLNMRIPIYQAALGMTILFVGFLFIFKKEGDRLPNDFQPALSQSSNRSILGSEPNVVVIKRIQDQNIGLSVQDDSLLFRMFTRSI